ncbi:hypothetical protein Ahy_A01g003660 isoform K [Arachis hypogaea]|uniref:Uncharacterized protein n=1 Tax=Arachis hypogaea TaxID=3818 RepID=A0A445ETR2_ARAHY|nr:hypothetical protein Ahy_A01g003660 isoform K [Arachis hypogaea]
MRKDCELILNPSSSPDPPCSTLLFSILLHSTLRCSKIPLPHILPLLRIVNIKLPPSSARHILAPSPSYSAHSKTTEGDGNDAGYYALCMLEISALLAFGTALYSCIALCGAWLGSRSNLIGSIQVLPQHHHHRHYLCFLLNLNLPISNLKPQ